MYYIYEDKMSSLQIITLIFLIQMYQANIHVSKYNIPFPNETALHAMQYDRPDLKTTKEYVLQFNLNASFLIK
jgi:hypothetical protein